jgi:alkylation response protein AidB-like acyl-CoA dehydrogenase
MDFALTEEQVLLRDTARRLLSAECPPGLVRAHIDDRSLAGPEGLWRHLSQWTELGDGPLVDLCLFLEETGAVAAPGPFLATTALWAPLHGVHGLGGTGTIALAGASGQWTVNDEPVKTFVLDADLVDHVGFIVGTLERSRFGSAPTASVALREVGMLDPSRRVFEVTVPDDLETTPLDPAVVIDLLGRAHVALAAEMLGTSRWIFDHTLEYAKQREQFGRPIGSFQALQHKLANMALLHQRAWAAVYYAAIAIDAGDGDRWRAAHVAKASAGEASRLCAKDGIQIHGGVGFTWEHDLHLFLRRAFGSEHLLGTTDWHYDRLADLILT